MKDMTTSTQSDYHNQVCSLVCTQVFQVPMERHLSLNKKAQNLQSHTGQLDIQDLEVPDSLAVGTTAGFVLQGRLGLGSSDTCCHDHSTAGGTVPDICERDIAVHTWAAVCMDRNPETGEHPACQDLTSLMPEDSLSGPLTPKDYALHFHANCKCFDYEVSLAHPRSGLDGAVFQGLPVCHCAQPQHTTFLNPSPEENLFCDPVTFPQNAWPWAQLMILS